MWVPSVRPVADIRASRERSFNSISTTNKANKRRRGSDPTRPNDHLMTSSARCSNDCGIMIPSAFAVLRLMTNSNFVGCWISKSAGFAPFNIPTR